MASTISINGNIFDTSNSTVESKDASGSDYIYILGKANFIEDQKQTLAKLGAVIIELVYTKTYLCQYTATDLQPIRASTTFVQAVGVFPQVVKSTITLKSIIKQSPQEAKQAVYVYFHEKILKTPQEVTSEIASKVGLAESEIQQSHNGLLLLVDKTKIESIASVDSVKRIEEYREPVLCNDLARGICYTSNYNPVIDDPPYMKYQGRGENICVADTGIDKDHPMFKNKKVDVLFEQGKDVDGHGTFCAAQIIGSGKTTNKKVEVSVHGTATQANLFMQTIGRYDSKTKKFVLEISKKFYHTLDKAKTVGCLIHSNSWAFPSPNAQLGYDNNANALDFFTNEWQEFLVVFAAGNQGYDDIAGTYRGPRVGAVAIAKNALTVGATLSAKSNANTNAYDPNALQNANLLGNLVTVATYSETGPTLPAAGGALVPGRIKPDVVAPGSAILSARSKDISPKYLLDYQAYGVWPDEKYMFSTGTSMAAPLVAGCCAGIRQAIAEMKPPFKSPSAALIKALVINGTVDCQGNHNGRIIPPAPNGIQGFGRIDMNASLLALDGTNANVGFIDAKDPSQISRGEIRTYRPLTAAHPVWSRPDIPYAPNLTFKATLVYPDPPGERTQNNLNLVVRIVNAIGAVETHGNQVPLAPAFDTVNNVEKVVWPTPPAGNLEIRVQVDAITKVGGEQNFAVVWTSV